MRLYPPIIGLRRIAIQPDALAGPTIEQGTMVVTSPASPPFALERPGPVRSQALSEGRPEDNRTPRLSALWSGVPRVHRRCLRPSGGDDRAVTLRPRGPPYGSTAQPVGSLREALVRAAGGL